MEKCRVCDMKTQPYMKGKEKKRPVKKGTPAKMDGRTT